MIILAIYISLLCGVILLKFDQTQKQIEIFRQDSYCQFHDISNQIACLDGNCDTWEIADDEGVNQCRELFKEKLE